MSFKRLTSKEVNLCTRTICSGHHQWFRGSNLMLMGQLLFTLRQSVLGLATICDHAGRVEAALSKYFAAPLRPLETEAKAMKERVLFAWDVGILYIVMGSDSMIVIDALMGSSDPQAIIANFIEGTWQKLQDFRIVQLSHIKRQGNRPAHVLGFLAQYVKNFDAYVTWIEENPFIVEFALTHEVPFLFS